MGKKPSKRSPEKKRPALKAVPAKHAAPQARKRVASKVLRAKKATPLKKASPAKRAAPKAKSSRVPLTEITINHSIPNDEPEDIIPSAESYPPVDEPHVSETEIAD